jgi:hypothetical protein
MTGCTALGFPRKATGGRALATTIYASQSRLSDWPAVMEVVPFVVEFEVAVPRLTPAVW